MGPTIVGAGIPCVIRDKPPAATLAARAHRASERYARPMDCLRMRGLAVVLAIGSAAACSYAADSGGGDDYRDPYMDEPLPPNCRDTDATTGSGSTGVCGDTEAAQDECERSSDCADGLACLSDFDGDRSPFQCVPQCVATADENRWCTDDLSCCDPAAHCSPRGYCLLD